MKNYTDAYNPTRAVTSKKKASFYSGFAVLQHLGHTFIYIEVRHFRVTRI